MIKQTPETSLQPICLKDYTAPAYLIDTVALDVDLGAEATVVSARLSLSRRAGVAANTELRFDGEALDKAFFAGTNYKTNFICNLGYGDASKLHPRSPRPSFDEYCRVE